MSRASRPVLYLAEPPAQYLARPPVVVDCSALAGLLFQEEWCDLAAEKIHGRSLHAPFLLQAEIASVALKKHRQGFADLVTDALAQYAEMEINLYRVEPQDALVLALRYQLSTYDATYLWLAAELKAPLATFDEKLGRAAALHLAGLA
ncbi:MAG: type II toxin-antitoxin system VapC family toxin [Pseudomonadota bacterium]